MNSINKYQYSANIEKPFLSDDTSSSTSLTFLLAQVVVTIVPWWALAASCSIYVWSIPVHVTTLNKTNKRTCNKTVFSALRILLSYLDINRTYVWKLANEINEWLIQSMIQMWTRFTVSRYEGTVFKSSYQWHFNFNFFSSLA